MSLVFFTDRDLGNTFPDILATSGIPVERHRDHFAPDCADEDWLRVVGERGWIAVSRDTRIRYKPNELDAVVRHHVALLIVIGKAPHAVLARHFVATVPRITSLLERYRPPLIAKVHRPRDAELARDPRAPGTVSLWYPKTVKRARPG